MRIAIIGFGFVGSALNNSLKDSVKVLKVDPKLNTSIDDLSDFAPNIIFICVPTPMHDSGTQNLSILNDVIEQLKYLNLDSTVVLKSTVLPDSLLDLSKIMPNIIYNPEFLREKHADEDFIKSNFIVFGSKSGNTNLVNLTNFYKNYTRCKCKEFIETDLCTASLIKYSINTFLATKVSFFNELNKMFNKLEVHEEWDNFIDYLSKDPRIGNSHMSVPGHDGKHGFGGACLPKDSRALVDCAERLGSELSVLKQAINANNKIRKKYNIDQRESDQNINFISKNK